MGKELLIKPTLGVQFKQSLQIVQENCEVEFISFGRPVSRDFTGETGFEAPLADGSQNKFFAGGVEIPRIRAAISGRRWQIGGAPLETVSIAANHLNDKN
jgi:hypothetical protein